MLPLWGGTVQGNGKDLLYTEIITLFSICLIEVVRAKQYGKPEMIKIISVGIGASLLRNNGIYAVIPTVIALVCYLKGIDRKRMWLSVCLITLIYGSIVKIIYPAMGIPNGSVREALSIPFLQTARYVCTYGNEVTEHEKSVIDSVLDYESMETYNPRNADSVKNTYKEDNSKLPEYFKVWFSMFWKHPGCYIEAFLNKAATFLAPVDTEFPAPIGVESEDYITEKGVTHPFGNRFANYFVHLEYANMEMPLIKYFCMAGTYTWVLLVCILLILREKVYGGIILLIPQIMNILVCIASPTWSIRYALPVVAVLPLMLGWTYYLILNKKMERKIDASL